MRTSFRRLSIIYLVISVIVAGMGLGHATASQSEDHSYHAHKFVSSDHAHGAEVHDLRDHNEDADSQYHQKNCHGEAQDRNGVPSSGHGNGDGCCHNASLPTVTLQDDAQLTTITYDVAGLIPCVGRIADSLDPEGQFKPPRL